MTQEIATATRNSLNTIESLSKDIFRLERALINRSETYIAEGVVIEEEYYRAMLESQLFSLKTELSTAKLAFKNYVNKNF